MRCYFIFINICLSGLFLEFGFSRFLHSLFLNKLYIYFNFRWIPESPSWLIVVGKSEKAVEVLKNVAKINKQNFDVSLARR